MRAIARAIGLGLAACLLGCSSGALPASGTPAGGLGVNAQVLLLQMPPKYWAANLAEMRADGIRIVRTDAPWGSVEPTAPGAVGHRYDWRSLDAIVRVLALNGMRWLPIADYSAYWAGSNRVGGIHQILSPPQNYADFVSYAAALVARYGPGGAFWAQHPELTALPIQGFEVWNEPDSPWAWPHPNPADYARLYAATRDAAHAIAPNVQVIVGGISPASTAFLDGLYSALGRPGKMDAVGIHPYAADASGVVAGVARIRAAMDAHGDVNVPIDVTEFGWSTARGDHPISDAERAVRMSQAVNWLARSDCDVERILPHTWVTREADPSNAEDWFGVAAPDGAPHRTANALGQAYRSLERTSTPTRAIYPVCQRPLTLTLTKRPRVQSLGTRLR